jgi:hypothetical protein
MPQGGSGRAEVAKPGQRQGGIDRIVFVKN